MNERESSGAGQFGQLAQKAQNNDDANKDAREGLFHKVTL
jgi:hypothetical protein